MSNQTKKGTGREAQFSKYKTSKVYEANKRRKLERTVKNQPNNEQAKLALKDISFRRKAPKVPQWSSTTIRIVELFKLFAGEFDKNFFDKDIEKSVAAANVRNPELFKNTVVVPKQKSMFSIGARAHDGRGNLVWGQ